MMWFRSYQRSGVVSPGILPGRVLIIIENIPYQYDARVKNEALALRLYGWEVHVLCPRAENSLRKEAKVAKKDEPDAGIFVHYLPSFIAEKGFVDYFREYASSFYHIWRNTLKLWKQRRFDVIHLCNPPDFLIFSVLFYKLMGAKIVYDQHDLFPEMIKSRFVGFSGWLLYYFARILEFVTYQASNLVIVTNESYREVALGRGRIECNRVHVVRNGPRLDEFLPMKPQPSLKKGFSFLACYAGIMGDLDGLLPLIRSIDYVINVLKRKDIYFVLLGNGSARPNLIELIRECQLGGFVEMPGMIRDRELFRSYLSTADVLLAPETSNPLNDKSTFIKIAEYMAMGKPIVAYDLHETRITAGESAIYVPDGDPRAYGKAIVEILADADRRTYMGDLGRRRIEGAFSWEHQQGNLIAAYNKLL